MLAKIALTLCLALFALPLVAHAEMPGQRCESTQIGTTKMADDKQNIIACLATGNTTPGANVAEWKSMSSGGGGGITGGCLANSYPLSNTTKYSYPWGKGCKETTRQLPRDVKGFDDGGRFFDGGPEPGYSCGATGMCTYFQDDGVCMFVSCVKN